MGPTSLPSQGLQKKTRHGGRPGPLGGHRDGEAPAGEPTFPGPRTTYPPKPIFSRPGGARGGPRQNRPTAPLDEKRGVAPGFWGGDIHKKGRRHARSPHKPIVGRFGREPGGGAPPLERPGCRAADEGRPLFRLPHHPGMWVATHFRAPRQDLAGGRGNELTRAPAAPALKPERVWGFSPPLG